VGLKLATASPNGRMPAGKRSSLWYLRHLLVGYLWNATSPIGSALRIAAAMCGGTISSASAHIPAKSCGGSALATPKVVRPHVPSS
jgi:hypothetical protein